MELLNFKSIVDREFASVCNASIVGWLRPVRLTAESLAVRATYLSGLLNSDERCSLCQVMMFPQALCQ